jgi:glycosyltransferase involved in cell wall biosynthesis
MKLSIIIPVYNEEKTILEILSKIDEVKISPEKEIIIVDDGSKDKTREILSRINGRSKNKKIIFHDKNYGKGHAILTGLKHASGQIILIQDADLEYDPNDYSKLIAPIINKKAKVVYGSRNLRDNKRSAISFYLGGRFLSFLANLLYGTKITDEATCYKVFRADIIKNIDLKCEKFEFCPEVTAKVAKKGINILEVPISYYPRGKKQGKKIKWKDGIEAIWALIKYRFID